jgi:hypothetical protein
MVDRDLLISFSLPDLLTQLTQLEIQENERYQHGGKEANRWEEQFYLGEMPEAQIEYGISKRGYERILEVIADAAKEFTQSALAVEAGISRRELIPILLGQSVARPRTIRALLRANVGLRTRAC